jgi:hypothetical protein
MNLTERLIPHLILVAALLPSFVLLGAAAVSLWQPGSVVALPAPLQAAVAFCPGTEPELQ